MQSPPPGPSFGHRADLGAPAEHEQPASYDDVTRWSALQIAIALRRRAVTTEAVTNAFLARIRAENERLGAFVSHWPERALNRARRIDTALARGESLPGTFVGVPTAIKDLDPTRGAFNRMGARAARYLWSPIDGPVAARVRRGGFNIVGKTATSEFGLLPIVETEIHPPCRNPWNTDYSAGGSSGGAGSAVAARLVPIAQGSDSAGSIRIPAAFCGLFGFKPSRGVLPSFYAPLDLNDLCTVHCLSQTVEDSAAFLDTLLGRTYSPEDPTADSFLSLCRSAPERRHVKYCLTSPIAEVDPAAERAVLDAVSALRDLGHDVQEGPPLAGTLDELLPIWARGAAKIPVVSERLTQPTTRWLRRMGRRITDGGARQLVGEWSARVLDWSSRADVWVTPTVGPHAPRVGASSEIDDVEARFRALSTLAAFTAPLNVSGQPAASVPFGRSARGVPVGVQVAGRPGSDADLFALCRTLETLVPWRRR